MSLYKQGTIPLYKALNPSFFMIPLNVILLDSIIYASTLVFKTVKG